MPAPYLSPRSPNRDTYLRRWFGAPARSDGGPGWAVRPPLARRFFGLLALAGDLIAEGSRQASRWRYPDLDTPERIASLTGIDRGFPRYPNEAPLPYLNRINDHWEGHRLAATKSGCEGLFATAGIDASLILETWPDYRIVVWDVEASFEVVNSIADRYLSAKLSRSATQYSDPDDLGLAAAYRAQSSSPWSTATAAGPSATATSIDHTASDSRVNGEPSATVASLVCPNDSATRGFMYAVLIPEAPIVSEGSTMRFNSGGSNPSQAYLGLNSSGEITRGGLVVGENPAFNRHPRPPRLVVLAWDRIEGNVRVWVDGQLQGAELASTSNFMNSSAAQWDTDQSIAECGYAKVVATEERMSRLYRYAKRRYRVL